MTTLTNVLTDILTGVNAGVVPSSGSIKTITLAYSGDSLAAFIVEDTDNTDRYEAVATALGMTVTSIEDAARGGAGLTRSTVASSYFWDDTTDSVGNIYNLEWNSSVTDKEVITDVILSIGTNDTVGIPTGLTSSQYEDALVDYMNHLLSDLDKLERIYVRPMGRHESSSDVDGWEGARVALYNAVDRVSKAYIMGESYDLMLSDTVHLTDGEELIQAERDAKRVAYITGNYDQPMLGMEIISAVVQDDGLLMNIKHHDGTDWTKPTMYGLATQGMTLDYTWDDINTSYTNLGEVSDISVRINVVLDNSDTGVIFESGALGSGQILYIYDGKLYYQCGDGRGIGSASDRGEVEWTIPNSDPKEYVIEISASTTQCALFINGELIDTDSGYLADNVAGSNAGGIGKSHNEIATNRAGWVGDNQGLFTGSFGNAFIYVGETQFTAQTRTDETRRLFYVETGSNSVNISSAILEKVSATQAKLTCGAITQPRLTTIHGTLGSIADRNTAAQVPYDNSPNQLPFRRSIVTPTDTDVIRQIDNLAIDIRPTYKKTYDSGTNISEIAGVNGESATNWNAGQFPSFDATAFGGYGGFDMDNSNKRFLDVLTWGTAMMIACVVDIPSTLSSSVELFQGGSSGAPTSNVRALISSSTGALLYANNDANAVENLGGDFRGGQHVFLFNFKSPSGCDVYVDNGASVYDSFDPRDTFQDRVRLFYGGGVTGVKYGQCIAKIGEHDSVNDPSISAIINDMKSNHNIT